MHCGTDSTRERQNDSYFHIDIAEVRTAEGKLYLYVAIDRTSKFAFVRLEDKASTVTATAFLAELVQTVPYTIQVARAPAPMPSA